MNTGNRTFNAKRGERGQRGQRRLAREPLHDPSLILSQSHAPSILVRVLIVLSMSFSLLPIGLDWSNAGETSFTFTEGSWALQLQFGTVFLLAAWLAWRNRGWTWSHILHLNPFLTMIVLYCAITMLWSPYPIITLKRTVQMAGLVLTGLAIAPPVGIPRQFTQILLATLMVLLGLSFVVSLTIPSVGVDYTLGGAWRGIFTQKNTMGAIAGLCVTLWVREMFGVTVPRMAALGGMVFCIFMLIMAKSSTAILVATLGTAIYLMLRRPYVTGSFFGWRVVIVLLMAVLLGGFLFFVFNGRLMYWSEFITPFATVFQKSSDLTGRTDIWNLVLVEIEKHPFFGIGYGAFWLGEGSPSQYIISALFWTPLQAHNGYLDILNELGLAGLMILIGVFLFHIRNLARYLKVDRDDAAIHWAIFILIVISNISESEVFRGVLFQNIFFIYSSTAISSALNVIRRTTQAQLAERRNRSRG